jgi:uncharacterized protein (TIGR02996 family)
VSEREALLAAIRQFPDEDTPRLMYADWLEEHKEHPHATLIRYQCGLTEQVPRADYRTMFNRFLRCRWNNYGFTGSRSVNARERTAAVYAEIPFGGVHERLRETWHHDPHNIQEGFTPRIVYRRGMIELVRLEWSHWLDHSKQLLAQNPVRDVLFITIPILSSQIQSPLDGWTEYLRRLIAKHPGVKFRCQPTAVGVLVSKLPD